MISSFCRGSALLLRHTPAGICTDSQTEVLFWLGDFPENVISWACLFRYLVVGHTGGGLGRQKVREAAEEPDMIGHAMAAESVVSTKETPKEWAIVLANSYSECARDVELRQSQWEQVGVERKQKGGFVKGWFWRMYPHSGFWNSCSVFCTPVPLLGVEGTSAKTETTLVRTPDVDIDSTPPQDRPSMQQIDLG